MAISKPFNLDQWIEDNRELLKPPVANKNMYVQSKDYIVMIVAGPNARKDYHFNETEELFYQLEGNIQVNIQEDGQKREMKLAAKKGEYYHLWWHPHNFGTYPQQSIEDLKEILEYYKVLNAKYGFKSLNMANTEKLLSKK